MGSVAIETPAGTTDFDMLIVGAGVSGVNSAYRVQTELPKWSYAILETRDAMGGTWDLFRYPGIRSDSDLHTFGFPWRPWPGNKSIVPGGEIKSYIEDSARAFGIDKHIKYGHKLLSCDWSDVDQRWTLVVDARGEQKVFTSRFIFMSTGYYDYNKPLEADIPGIANFKGQTIHPQFWPEDLDYTNKKVVIIGSGATSVTLLPSMTDKAAKVTMLQRSPTYILPRPAVDPLSPIFNFLLPRWWALKMIRWKNLVLPFIFFKFCRGFPNAARWLLKKAAQRELGKNTTVPVDPNFKPSYGPWEQRLCVCPDGDFYKAIKSGKGDVVTDTIASVEENGIQTTKGIFIPADIIITATGLKMQLAGGATVSVNGKHVDPADKFIWRGIMLQDVPNMAFVIGYTNASWTLGSDTTALHVCRLLTYLDNKKLGSAVPNVPKDQKMQETEILNLNSTYIYKAKGALPKAGTVWPWTRRENYMVDTWTASYGALTTGLQFQRAKTA